MTRNDEKLLTPAEHREAAKAYRQRSAESWERSDTDGFLSQWALDSLARGEDLKAELAEAGGVSDFIALFDLDGNLVPAKYIETRYGWAWALLESTDPRSRIKGFFNESNARKESTRLANNRKKGFTVGKVLAPAKIVTGTQGQPVTVRAGEEFSTDVEVITTEYTYVNRTA